MDFQVHPAQQSLESKDAQLRCVVAVNLPVETSSAADAVVEEEVDRTFPMAEARSIVAWPSVAGARSVSYVPSVQHTDLDSKCFAEIQSVGRQLRLLPLRHVEQRLRSLVIDADLVVAAVFAIAAVLAMVLADFVAIVAESVAVGRSVRTAVDVEAVAVQIVRCCSQPK